MALHCSLTFSMALAEMHAPSNQYSKSSPMVRRLVPNPITASYPRFSIQPPSTWQGFSAPPLPPAPWQVFTIPPPVPSSTWQVYLVPPLVEYSYVPRVASVPQVSALTPPSAIKPPVNPMKLERARQACGIKRLAQDKSTPLFLVTDAGFKSRSVALMAGIKQKTLIQSVGRERKRRKVNPLLEVEVQVIDTRGRDLRESLWKEKLLDGLLPKGTEVLSFPEPDKNSAANLARPLRLIKGTKKTFDLGMYVFMHCGLASELVAASQRGVTVRVVTDFSMRNTVRSHLKELMLAGIAVVVHETASFMHHEKAAIVDKSTVMFGNANWTEHVLTSAGHVYIHKAFGAHPVKTDFDGYFDTYILLAFKHVEDSAPCEACAKRLKIATEFAKAKAALTKAKDKAQATA